MAGAAPDAARRAATQPTVAYGHGFRSRIRPIGESIGMQPAIWPSDMSCFGSPERPKESSTAALVQTNLTNTRDDD
jgi:hypothetical protein